MHQFEATVVTGGETGAWLRVMIPPAVSEALGSRGRVPVAGRVNGFSIKSSLFVNPDGTHHLMFNRTMQKGTGAVAGTRVRVELEAA